MEMNISKALKTENNNVITGTELKGGSKANGIKLNYQIAEAITTIPQVESFSKGQVSVMIDFIPDEIEGYIYKNDGLIVFFDYNKDSHIREIDQLIINKEEGDYKPHHLIQAFILLDLAVDKTTLNIKDSILSFINTTTINENSELFDDFIETTQVIENLFKDGTFDPYKVEINEEIEDLPVGNVLSSLGITTSSPSPSVLEVKEDEETVEATESIDDSIEETDASTNTSEETKHEVAEQGDFDFNPVTTAEKLNSLQTNGITLKQIADVTGVSQSTVSKYSDVDKVHDLSNRQLNTLKRIANALENANFNSPKLNVETTPTVETPKVEVVKEVTVESFDINKIKKERPNFFDDNWVIDYLKKFDISPILIDAVIKYRQKKRETLGNEFIIEVEPVSFYAGYKEPLEKAITCVLTDVNLILKGEAGSGKTTLVQSVSALFNMPLFTINGSDESNIETIVGFKEIENKSIVFKEGRLVKAMRSGGIFYADEANMIRPNILAVINGAIDHRKELYNEFTGERIKGDKDYRFMASINEDYEDTRQMNRATLDRSVSCEMTYMGIEQLKEMLAEFDPGYNDFQKEILELDDVSRRDIITLANIAKALQLGVKNEQFSPEVASIRNIIHLLKLTRLLPFEEAIKMIVQKYPREDRAEIATVLSSVEGINLSPEEIVEAV